MTAISLRGYCRTLSERIACNPAIRITRLTTTASTGRFTNRSVNFIRVPLAVTGLAVLWVGAGTVLRFYGVVHLDRRPIAQAEASGAYDFVSRVNAGNDSNLVAA